MSNTAPSNSYKRVRYATSTSLAPSSSYSGPASSSRPQPAILHRPPVS